MEEFGNVYGSFFNKANPLYLYALALGLALIVLPGAHRSTGLFYAVLIMGASLFAYHAQKSLNSRFSSFYLLISFLFLFLPLGLRQFSGVDDTTYARIFYEVNSWGWIKKFTRSSLEPGYLILNRLVGLFTRNYIYMQIISSFIPLAIFYGSFKKYGEKIDLTFAVFLLATTIYFQVLSVGLVRMFMAISIIFRGLYYLPLRNSKKYIAHVALASLFHYSAIFMIILIYFTIDNRSFSLKAKRFVLLAFLLVPLIFIFVPRYLVPLLGSRYSIYANLGPFLLSIWDFSTIPLLVIILFFYHYKDSLSHDYFLVSMSTLTMTTILGIYGSLVPFGRLIYYTNSSLFILAPLVGQNTKDRGVNKILFYSLVIVYSVLFLYRTQFMFQSHIPHLFPYKNIFFQIGH